MTHAEALNKALNHARTYGVHVRVIADRGWYAIDGTWWYIVLGDQGEVLFG